MRSAPEIMAALDSASKGVEKASTELSKLITEFHEGFVEPDGSLIMGIGLRFDTALKEELSSIYEDAIENSRRAPAEDIRAAMASKAVQTKQPDLWAEYHSKKARIEALKLWLSNQKAAISANQSVLRGERQ